MMGMQYAGVGATAAQLDSLNAEVIRYTLTLAAAADAAAAAAAAISHATKSDRLTHYLATTPLTLFCTLHRHYRRWPHRCSRRTRRTDSSIPPIPSLSTLACPRLRQARSCRCPVRCSCGTSLVYPPVTKRGRTSNPSRHQRMITLSEQNRASRMMDSGYDTTLILHILHTL